MQLDEFAREIEPQSCSTDARLLYIVCPHKAPKDACLLLRRNAYTTITDAQECCMSLSLFADRHLDGTALWAVLESIADDVRQHLLYASTIDVNDEGWQRRREGEAMLLCSHLESFHQLLGQCYQVGWFTVQDQASCLQTGHIEQIPGEFVQATSHLVNLLDGPCHEGVID